MLPNFSIIWVTPLCGGQLFTIVIIQRFLNIPDLVLGFFWDSCSVICICTYTHICMLVRIHRHTCTKKCMYIYIYTHTYTRMNYCLSWANTWILQKLWRNLLSFGNFSQIKYLLMSSVCPSDSLAQRHKLNFVHYLEIVPLWGFFQSLFLKSIRVIFNIYDLH